MDLDRPKKETDRAERHKLECRAEPSPVRSYAGLQLLRRSTLQTQCNAMQGEEPRQDTVPSNLCLSHDGRKREGNNLLFRDHVQPKMAHCRRGVSQNLPFQH